MGGNKKNKGSKKGNNKESQGGGGGGSKKIKNSEATEENKNINVPSVVIAAVGSGNESIANKNDQPNSPLLVTVPDQNDFTNVEIDDRCVANGSNAPSTGLHVDLSKNNDKNSGDSRKKNRKTDGKKIPNSSSSKELLDTNNRSVEKKLENQPPQRSGKGDKQQKTQQRVDDKSQKDCGVPDDWWGSDPQPASSSQPAVIRKNNKNDGDGGVQTTAGKNVQKAQTAVKDTGDEFDAYCKDLKSQGAKIQRYERVVEKEGDLFAMGVEFSLAHCVAEDMNMGSGIAVQFRRDFKCIDQLLDQRQKQGGLAYLEVKGRFIYYLVTKRLSNGKPTLQTLFTSLIKLRAHIQSVNVRKLAMPRIGCGLDRLEWSDVKFMLEFIFKDIDVDIVICNFQQDDNSLAAAPNTTATAPHRNCKLANVVKPICAIEPETLIIYLTTEDAHVSQEMRELDRKFNFLNDFQRMMRTKRLGQICTSEYPQYPNYYFLCGCVVKKVERDPLSFVDLQKCIGEIQRSNRKWGFQYVGFQAIQDRSDDCINYKIVNILRNSLRNVEVYVCWDGELVKDMPFTNRIPE